MTSLLRTGALLLGAFLAVRLVRVFKRHLAGQRAFLFFVVILGASALASDVLSSQPPAAVGVGMSRSWMRAYLLSTLLGAVLVYPLSKGFFGSPLGRARPSAPVKEIQSIAVAVFVGIVEEYYFRGAWGSLCRGEFGPVWGAAATNGVFVSLLWVLGRRGKATASPRALHLLTLATLYGFGLSLSWAWEVSQSLAIPAGIHTGIYYVYHHWPRLRAGRSPKTLAYWTGGEDPALGLGPVAVYWIAAGLSLWLVPWLR